MKKKVRLWLWRIFNVFAAICVVVSIQLAFILPECTTLSRTACECVCLAVSSPFFVRMMLLMYFDLDCYKRDKNDE